MPPPGSSLMDSLSADPLTQLRLWLDEAQGRNLPEFNAMTLATVGVDGRPAARIVLCKEVDARGVIFYTNYLSRKGIELAQNPAAALCFYWPDLARQVRLEGDVERLTAEESAAYFVRRPRGSQIGAWASAQSQPAE